MNFPIIKKELAIFKSADFDMLSDRQVKLIEEYEKVISLDDKYTISQAGDCTSCLHRNTSKYVEPCFECEEYSNYDGCEMRAIILQKI